MKKTLLAQARLITRMPILYSGASRAEEQDDQLSLLAVKTTQPTMYDRNAEYREYDATGYKKCVYSKPRSFGVKLSSGF